MRLLATLSQILFASKPLKTVVERLEAGEDATVGIPFSARPFFVASTFAKEPRPTLVILAGEEAAYLFARDVAAWLSNDAVRRFPERRDYPWSEQPLTQEDINRIGQRARAIDALTNGKPCVVVASVRALLRAVPPRSSGAFAPLEFVSGRELGAGSLGTGQTPPGFETGQTAPGLGTGQSLPPASSSITYDALPFLLTQRGYTRLDALDGVGTFSIRGDVLDVYPAGLGHPVRIEFFGEEIECIRRIVPATGQSIAMLSSLKIYPAHELSYDVSAFKRAERIIHTLEGPQAAALPKKVTQHLEHLKEGIPFRAAEQYLPYLFAQPVTPIAYAHENTRVVLVEPRTLVDDAARAYDEICASAKLARVSPEDLYFASTDLDFGSQQRLTLASLMAGGAMLDARLEVKHVDIAGSDEKLCTSIQSLLASGYHAVLGIPGRRAREDMLYTLSDAHIPFIVWNEDRFAFVEKTAGECGVEHTLADEAPDKASDKTPSATLRSPLPAKKILTVTDIDIPSPLTLPDAKIALLTLADTSVRRLAARGKDGQTSARDTRYIDPTSLMFSYKPGDYVVHETHGIALFKAIVRREIADVERDYLHLEYAKGDRLFVPVEQINRVTRYVGPESAAPRLTSLNTSDWTRAAAKARSAARQMAFDLVDLYVRRSATQGFAYEPDTLEQRLMEEAFSYEETPDQLAAIADVKADMESRKPMDRLICGDVGFGKTEVALRAAFKAAQNGKQVLLLCPTTILAQQHFTTFSERFEPFAVEVDVLSRFRSEAQQRDILKRFSAGTLDVLVGTHRLLSADVNPRDLGLVIIDEEQRFGVQHKEQLKNLREYIDVLTLSATPIPRTMSMAMSGVRDMSLIDTPPRSRTPIKVYVGEWNEDMVSAAIRREISRGGQVYYVSNRIKSLDAAVARVAAVAPEARVALAHGRMGAMALEAVMEQFSANEYDVLISTTIIESGLDNPHTNTLIIEDSQRLGLAQLYQLKGRVGRSHAQAFAYFLFPSHEALTPQAVERLMAIDEFQDLGSGTKVAMRDLEIRGAGSLLGAEQHGMLSAVGFDLFASMLREAVEAQQTDGGWSGDFLSAGSSSALPTGSSPSSATAASAALPAGSGASWAESGASRPAPGAAGRKPAPVAGRKPEASGRAPSSSVSPSITASSFFSSSSARQDVSPARFEVRIDLPVPFFLPEEYVAAVDERVVFYRRLAAAKDSATITMLASQLADRYGALPKPAHNLIERHRAKVYADELGVHQITLVRGCLFLAPLELGPAQCDWIKKQRKGVIYAPQSRKLQFPVGKGTDMLATLIRLLETLLEPPASTL